MKDLLIQTAASVDPVGSTAEQNPTYFTNGVSQILYGIIATLGLACVVVMIVGGVNYMTSAGDTNKVEKGKKTILYGAIGLIICVLSFAIVNFVISNIISSPDGLNQTQCEKNENFKWVNKKGGYCTYK